MPELESLIGPVLTVVITIIAFNGTTSAKFARLETKMDSISEEVRKYNGIAERVGKLEAENKQLWHTIHEIKQELKELNQQA